MRLNRYVVAGAALALAASGTLLGAGPVAALSCPTVNPDKTVDVPADVTWNGCDLDGAILDGLVIPTNIDASSFVGASLRGVTFLGGFVDVQNQAPIDFTDADLTGADFNGKLAPSTILTRADLSGAQLAGAVLAYVHVDGTKFAGAHLEGSTVTIADGYPASLPPLWKRVGVVPNGPLVTAVLAGPGAQLSRVPLQNPDFRGASLAGADLSLSDLTGGIFDGVDLTGADFRHSWLYSNDFTGALNFGKAFWDGAYQMDSTCPDGVKIDKHDGVDCTRPLDTVAPKVALPGGDVWLLKDRASWPIAVTENGSGIADGDARWRTRTAGRTGFPSWTTYGWGTVGLSDPWTVEYLSSGDRYCVQVRGRDRAGNAGAWSNQRCAEVPYDQNDAEGVYSGWSEKKATWAFGGTYRLTRTKGASLKIERSMRIRTVGVVASTCPDCGSVAVYVGSRKVGSISLRRSTTTTQRVVVLPRLASTLTGQLRFVVTSATGKTVRLDGFVASAS